MSNIFNDEYSKLYDFNNYNKKADKVINKFINYIKNNDIQITSHIDFGCGTGYFCKLISDMGIDTMGIDISHGMLKIAKEKYPNIDFKDGNIVDYKSKNKVDFISCNYDTVNHLLDFSEWKLFFENVYKNLNDGGLFLFDFVTMQKFKDTNEIEFSTRNNNYDYLICRIPIDNNRIISKFIFYIKENDSYKKVEQSITESFFDNDNIFNLLRETGFKILETYDKDLNKLENDSNRIYVICQK